MGALTHAQADALHRALLHLYEPVEPGRFPERVFEAARMLVPFEAGGLSIQERDGWTGHTVLSVPAYDAASRLAEHAEAVHALPGFASGALFSTAAPVFMLDFMSADAFRGSAIYELFYKEMDVFHEATLNYHVQANRSFFQLHLARKKQRFTAGERFLLGFFQPHLSQRCRQLLALERRDPFFLASDCLGDDDKAWLVCADSGRIRGFGPRLPSFFHRLGLPLRPHLPEGWREWMRGQTRPAHAADRRPLTCARGSLRVVVHCLPNRLSGEHHLILHSVRSDGIPALTAREREIARWLAAGKTNAEIGEILGISRLTARNHIQNILAKLGVENRTTAAALLVASGEEDSGPSA